MEEATEFQDCSVGYQIHDQCHKVCYSRCKGLVEFQSLSNDDRELLVWRSGVNLSPKDTICFHHEKVFLSRFEYLQKACADPYRKHQKLCNVSCFFVFFSF